ncbi:MAG: hydrogenase [Pseudomonadota bacterium]
MNELLNSLVMFLILLNFWLLSSSRLIPCIRILALQAVILTAIGWIAHADSIDLQLAAMLSVNFIVKGLVLPLMLHRVIIRTSISRELDPIVGYTTSLIIGALLLGLSFLISQPLYISHTVFETLFLPVSLFTLFSGLFITIARKKAITQVVGYMVMENGIYTFGIAMAINEPLVVELSVLLDVFVAVFIMGVAIFHITRQFDHMDTDRLSVLRDL